MCLCVCFKLSLFIWQEKCEFTNHDGTQTAIGFCFTPLFCLSNIFDSLTFLRGVVFVLFSNTCHCVRPTLKHWLYYALNTRMIIIGFISLFVLTFMYSSSRKKAAKIIHSQMNLRHLKTIELLHFYTQQCFHNVIKCHHYFYFQKQNCKVKRCLWCAHSFQRNATLLPTHWPPTKAKIPKI